MNDRGSASALFDMPDASHSFEERGGWLVKRLCTEFELAPHQAAGIAGNLGFESGGFEKLQEIRPSVAGSRGGWGWAQWTGPRRRQFEAWAAAAGLAPASDEANFGFLMVELRGAYRRVVEQLRATLTVEVAVFVFGHDFEAPGGTTRTHLPGFADRLRYARRALAGAGGAPQPQPAAPAPATPARPPPASARAGLAPSPSPDGEGEIDPDSDEMAERLNREELERIRRDEGQG
jgi:tail lysozyme